MAITPEQKVRTTRRARALRDRLLARSESDGPRSSDNVEALIRVALLLAAEVPPEEADKILDALAPWANQIRPDHAAALSEAMVMRGRIEEAEAIWDRLDEVERMQAQLRCLGHRLVAAAHAYRDSPALDAVVEVIIEGPVETLAALSQKANDRDTAIACYSGVRLLHRTLEAVQEHTPSLMATLARLTGPETPDEAMVNAAEWIYNDAEKFSIGPANVPKHMARDPILERIDDMVQSRMAPPRGRPSDPHAYVAMLREAVYGSTP